MSVNVNTTTNTVTVQNAHQTITIVDNNTANIINVDQPLVNVIEVATPGPQGPTGPAGSGGILTNVVPLYNYETNLNFGATLQSAINSVATGSIIDCTTYTGSQSITSSIIINKPLTIRLGYSDINVNFNTFNTSSHLFNINNTSNVIIEGLGRSPKSDFQSSPTRIIMNNTGSGYHIFGTGSNSIIIQNLDLIGVQSSNYDLTTGAGGVCFIEPNPGVSQAGNTVNNISISNLFVSGTRDHGIYFVGSILSEVKNCRVSNAGGHGFFTTEGSTSTQFTNCYASSGKLAGFCIYNTSYSTLENCSAENFSAGYWIRSSFNISLIGCGAESNKLSGTLPTDDLGISFGSYAVDDWTTSYSSLMSGSSYVLTGGKNIVLNNPYSKDPGGNGIAYNDTCHYAIASTNSGSILLSPRCVKADGPSLNYDILIKDVSGAPRDLNVIFNPENQGTVTPTTSGEYITTIYNPGTTNTVICDQGINTEVKSGNDYFTNITVHGDIIPAGPYINNTSSYNLGSPTAAWKDLYVSNGSVYFISGSTSSSISLNSQGNISIPSASLTGSLQGTASFATSASYSLTASYAMNGGGGGDTSGLVTTSSFNNYTSSINSWTSSIDSAITNFAVLDNSNTFNGNQTINGSLNGNVEAIADVTASVLDCSTGNFFTLNLPPNETTTISLINISAGQTVNLKIIMGGGNTVNIGSGIRESSDSPYSPSQTQGAVDILTFIAFENGGGYMSYVKNFQS